jgi:hypothetical protein
MHQDPPPTHPLRPFVTFAIFCADVPAVLIGRSSLSAYAFVPPCSFLWIVRSIYDPGRMPYGWRRCEQSYNSVAAPKADWEKPFHDRFPANHSIVCSPNVPRCFRSDHRTISSTLSCLDGEAGRLLSLAVAPVILTNDVLDLCTHNRRSVFSSLIYARRDKQSSHCD